MDFATVTIIGLDTISVAFSTHRVPRYLGSNPLT